MRLVELHTDPIRDAIKQSKNMNFPEFKWYAEKEFKHLASGNFSDVFQVPYNNMIMKVFMDDECYYKYAEFVYANRGNVHYPRISKIHSLRPWRDDSGIDNDLSGFVFIEQLDKIHMHHSGEELDIMRAMGRVFMKISSIKSGSERNVPEAKTAIYALNRLLRKSKKTIPDMAREYAPIFRTLQEIKRAIPNCSMDTHVDNFMIRPKTGAIVISDPVSFGTKY